LAVEKSPLAEEFWPVAVDEAPFAVAAAPFAVDPMPLAVAPLPVAVEPSPDAAAFVPQATEPKPVAVAPSPFTPFEQTNWACAVSTLPLEASPAMAKATEKNDSPICCRICISLLPSDTLLACFYCNGFPVEEWTRVLAELNGRHEGPTTYFNGKTQNRLRLIISCREK
jgi:hypothetical protein